MIPNLQWPFLGSFEMPWRITWYPGLFPPIRAHLPSSVPDCRKQILELLPLCTAAITTLLPPLLSSPSRRTTGPRAMAMDLCFYNDSGFRCYDYIWLIVVLVILHKCSWNSISRGTCSEGVSVLTNHALRRKRTTPPKPHRRRQPSISRAEQAPELLRPSHSLRKTSQGGITVGPAHTNGGQSIEGFLLGQHGARGRWGDCIVPAWPWTSPVRKGAMIAA
jgi:hypothetical protein